MNEQEAVTEIGTQIEIYRKEIEPREITNEDECKSASDVLKQVKDYIKTIDAKRREFVDPLNATVKKLNEQFKPMADVAEELRRKIEKKILSFQSDLLRKREEKERERKRIEAEALRKQAEDLAKAAVEHNSNDLIERAAISETRATRIENAPVKVSATVASAQSSSTIRRTWTFEVEIADEVPRSYCIPDDKLIRQAVRDGVRKINGVRIFEQESIQTR